MRNMLRIWQVNMDALTPQQYFETWEPCAPYGAYPKQRLDEAPPDPTLLALDTMSTVVSHGIKEFSPYLRLNAGRPNSTLFGATCAQLFNAVVEQRVWHRCARCDKPFLRRWSTASVQYCGERCAKAAASKAYRDRKRSDTASLTSGGAM